MNDLQSAATGPSADTLYHIWFEYEKATGAGNNAQCRLYVSTDTTKPSVTAQKTTGTPTAQSDGIDVSTKEGMDIVFDWVRVNTSAYAAGEPD